MFKGKKILAIIPARSGSKGILHKNLHLLKGKELIRYTIEAAKQSKYIDRIFISTDSADYRECFEKMGVEVPFLRPAELAADNSPTIATVMHVINELRERLGEQYDYMVLLQPTSPLRQSFHIDEALELLLNSGCNSLVSVSTVEEHPLLMRTIKADGTVARLLPEEQSTVRRQDFPAYYKVNGAIYINAVDGDLNNGTSLNDNKLAYVMERSYAVDIDEMADVEKAELILKRLK